MNNKLKIAFTGPECSGKTTLSKWLSMNCNWTLSEEYARQYLSEKKNYVRADLDEIAKQQFSMNNHAQIADTEMLVMDIWSRVKYGIVSQKIDTLLHKQQFEMYFLCKPDFEWEEDELRENPTNREQLFEYYLERINQLKWPYIVLEGSLENRKGAIRAIIKEGDL